MPRAMKGVLCECDPSIKVIIRKWDSLNHDYIVEDLDDERYLLIREDKVEELKDRLGFAIDEKIMQFEEPSSSSGEDRLPEREGG